MNGASPGMFAQLKHHEKVLVLRNADDNNTTRSSDRVGAGETDREAFGYRHWRQIHVYGGVG